jgi:hypothetical protein
MDTKQALLQTLLLLLCGLVFERLPASSKIQTQSLSCMTTAGSLVQHSSP